MTNTTEQEPSAYVALADEMAITGMLVGRKSRRWAFALQAACWVAGIASGLTMVAVVVLATFAQLDAFQ